MVSRIAVTIAVLAAAAALGASAADARSLKWARSGDAFTLDPHAQNEGPTTTSSIRSTSRWSSATIGQTGSDARESWRITEDPTVWEFKLRKGVKFHNGNAFDADDVMFSFERARQPTSDIKG